MYGQTVTSMASSELFQMVTDDSNYETIAMTAYDIVYMEDTTKVLKKRGGKVELTHVKKNSFSKQFKFIIWYKIEEKTILSKIRHVSCVNLELKNKYPSYE